MFFFKQSHRTPDNHFHLDISFILTLLLYLVCSVSPWPVTAWASDAALQWDANEDADYYIVYWRTADDSEPIDQSDPIDADTVSFPLYDSDEGTVYYYSIKAFNSCGNSSDYSDEIQSASSPYSSFDESDTYTVEIILPQVTIYEAGDLIDFSANVTVNGVLDTSSAVSWTSSIDGLIGTGADISATLSVGTHTVMASANDGETGLDSETIVISVLEGNSPPELSISSTAGELTSEGQSYALSASAQDEEDGDLSEIIVWSSDIDGALGTGAEITAVLSSGDHTIRAMVTDSGNKKAEQTIVTTAAAETELLIEVVSKRFLFFKIVKVTWSGGTTSVNIYKNGSRLASGGSEGTRYFWFSGAGRYRVCEILGGECSEGIIVK